MYFYLEYVTGQVRHFSALDPLKLPTYMKPFSTGSDVACHLLHLHLVQGINERLSYFKSDIFNHQNCDEAFRQHIERSG